MKILTKNIDRDAYGGSIGEYKDAGGYTALTKALKQMRPEEITGEVIKSGLRGRGGAGFPTGRKWTFLPKESDKPVYLICNADEGEPGTFKDKLIMEKDPHLVLEGMIISSYAIKANTAYIYIRGEFVRGAQRLENAVKEAKENGCLGRDILGSGHDIEIYVHRGAGAYICGEETSLLESLEGKRGCPRTKPPFPAIEGAFGCPTIVNNVETLANVPFIVTNGGDAYAEIGAENSSGTRLFCLSGHINNPGVYEIPMGISLRDLIYDVGGGIPGNKKLKAVIPGGSSMPVLKPDEIDVSMDFDSLAKIGTSIGSAGVIVMDETVDIVDVCLNVAEFYADESCGQCTPCREGMPWMRDIIRRIKNGRGKEDDIDMILDIANNIEGRTICPFGEAGAWPVKAFITKFREDFVRYVS